MRVVAALTSLAMSSAAIATPASTTVLQPRTSWDVDYGDTRCAAVRSFGSPSDPIAFGIVPSINGETYKLIVNVQWKGPIYAQEHRGTVDFGGAKIGTWLLHFGKKGANSSNYEFHLSAAEVERAKGATTVLLHSDSGENFQFALSQMPELLDALHRCTADLQQYWNYGARSTVPLTKMPKADLRSIFTGDDYPSEAQQRGQEGKAQYQLLVDEKGSVAGCDLIVQSGVPIIDVMGCQVLLERAKFTPALDGNGKGVRSVVTTPPIVWGLMP